MSRKLSKVSKNREGSRRQDGWYDEEKNEIHERVKSNKTKSMTEVLRSEEFSKNHVVATKKHKPRPAGKAYMGVRSWAKHHRPAVYNQVLDLVRDPALGALCLRMPIIPILVILRVFFKPNHIKIFTSLDNFVFMFSRFVQTFFQIDRSLLLKDYLEQCRRVRSDEAIMRQCLWRFGNAFLITGYVLIDPNVADKYKPENVVVLHSIPVKRLPAAAAKFFLKYGYDRNNTLNGANGEVTGDDDLSELIFLIILDFLRSLPLQKARDEVEVWIRRETELTVEYILFYIDHEIYRGLYFQDLVIGAYGKLANHIYSDVGELWRGDNLENEVRDLLTRINERVLDAICRVENEAAGDGYVVNYINPFLNFGGNIVVVSPQLNGANGEWTGDDDLVADLYPNYDDYQRFVKGCEGFLNENVYSEGGMVDSGFVVNCYSYYAEQKSIKNGYLPGESPGVLFLNLILFLKRTGWLEIIIKLVGVFLFFIMLSFYNWITNTKANQAIRIEKQIKFYEQQLAAVLKLKGGFGKKGSSFISGKVIHSGTGGKSKRKNPVSAPAHGIAEALNVLGRLERSDDGSVGSVVDESVGSVGGEDDWMNKLWEDKDRPIPGYKGWIPEWHVIKHMFISSALPNVVTKHPRHLAESFEMDCMGAPFCGMACIDVACGILPKVDVYLQRARHYDNIFENGTAENLSKWAHYRGVNLAIHYKFMDAGVAEQICEFECNPEWLWVHLSLKTCEGGRLKMADMYNVPAEGLAGLGKKLKKKAKKSAKKSKSKKIKMPKLVADDSDEESDDDEDGPIKKSFKEALVGNELKEEDFEEFLGHYYLMVETAGNITNLQLPNMSEEYQLDYQKGVHNGVCWAMFMNLCFSVFVVTASFFVARQFVDWSFIYLLIIIFGDMMVRFGLGYSQSGSVFSAFINERPWVGTLKMLINFVIYFDEIICLYYLVRYAFREIEVVRMKDIVRNRNDDDLRCIRERRTKIEAQDHYQYVEYSKVVTFLNFVIFNPGRPVECQEAWDFDERRIWWSLCNLLRFLESRLLWAIREGVSYLRPESAKVEENLVSIVRGAQAIKEGEFLPQDSKSKCLATIGKMSYVNSDDSIPGLFKNTERFVMFYFEKQHLSSQIQFENVKYAMNAQGRTSYIGDQDIIRVNQMDNWAGGGGAAKPEYRYNGVVRLNDEPLEVEKEKKQIGIAPLGAVHTDFGTLGPGNITITEHYSLIAAFAGRSMTKIVDDSSKLMKEFISFSKKFLTEFIEQTDIDDIEEKDVVECFRDINRKKKTKAQIDAKVREYQDVVGENNEGKNCRGNEFSCFVKLEDSTKMVDGKARVRPRLIMTMSSWFTVRICQVMEILTAWCHGPFSKFQVKGMSVSEFCARVQEMTDGAHMVTDYSAFESSIFGAVKEVENYVVSRLLWRSRLDSVATEWLKVNGNWEKKKGNIKERNRKLKSRAGTFSIDSRCSGDYHTSVGNGIVNVCLNAFAYFKKMGTVVGFDCIAEGDDGIIDPIKTDVSIVNALNFVFSCDVMGQNSGDTDFLQCRWMEGKCLLNIGRTIKSLFWVISSNMMSAERAKEILRCKALSVHATCPNHPILSAAIQRILFNTKPVRKKTMEQLNDNFQLKFGVSKFLQEIIVDNVKFGPILDSDRALVAEGAIGFPPIPVWLQLEIEHRLLNDEIFYIGSLLDEYEDIKKAKRCSQWKRSSPILEKSAEMISVLKILANPGIE